MKLKWNQNETKMKRIRIGPQIKSTTVDIEIKESGIMSIQPNKKVLSLV